MPKRARRIAARQAELGRKKKKKSHGPSAPEQRARKLAMDEGTPVAPQAQAAQDQPPSEAAPGGAPPVTQAPFTPRRTPPIARPRGQEHISIPVSVRTQLRGDLLRIAAVSGLIFVILAVLAVVLK